VAGTLFPGFGIPDWAFRFVVMTLAFGFIPTLIFSWAYEITPDGVKREKEVERDESITNLTAKRLDWLTIGLVIVALGVVAADRWWPGPAVVEESVPPAANSIDEATSTSPRLGLALDSIAVLPFANRSADPGDAYFVDGIHDDLLTHIAKIGAIRAISRTSVMHYRDSGKTIPDIARELDVATVLEGGVQRAGDQIRINVQLIDARTDEHIWAEIYDRKLTATNIFAIQSEIAESVSSALQAVLSPAEKHRIKAVPTESLEAYEAYLLGKQRYERMDTESLAEALDYFREAVRLDSKFALAWVGLADAYLAQGGGQRELPFGKARAEAEAALMTALEINPDLGEAYTSLGAMQEDPHEARRYFELALELSPNYPPLSRRYGNVMQELGKLDEALKWKAKAVELDPMSAELRRSYAVALRVANRIQEAVEQLDTALEIEPHFAGALDALATIKWQRLNRLDEAVKGFTQIINLYPSNSSGYVWLAQLYLDLNEPERASVLVERATMLAPEHPVTAWGQLLLAMNKSADWRLGKAAKAVLERDFGATWHFEYAEFLLVQEAVEMDKPSEAAAYYSQHYPQLMGAIEHRVTNEDFRTAINFAWVLQKTGQHEEADKLLELAYEFIRGKPRLGWWGGIWISDVQILVLQDKEPEALLTLRQATEEGWRTFWWYYLRHDPTLDSIRGAPELNRVLAEIESDMSVQMRRVREMEQRGEIPSIPGVIFDAR
jgi:TolB-like protein/cytochrome c-type biogenesis protein CcmH/NrfG